MVSRHKVRTEKPVVWRKQGDILLLWKMLLIWHHSIWQVSCGLKDPLTRAFFSADCWKKSLRRKSINLNLIIYMNTYANSFGTYFRFQIFSECVGKGDRHSLGKVLLLECRFDHIDISQVSIRKRNIQQSFSTDGIAKKYLLHSALISANEATKKGTLGQEKREPGYRIRHTDHKSEQLWIR